MSDPTGRIKNQPADRQEPDRSPGNAVNQGAATPGGAALGGDVADAVEKGVRLGYSVIEDYLKFGERFARQFNGRSYSVADYGRDLQSATEGLFTAFTDMSTRWVELVSSVVSGSVGQAGGASSGATGSSATAARPGTAASSGGAQAASPKASEVSVEVSSSRACGVRLDMGLPTNAQVLAADDLVRLTGGAEPLRAELEVRDGGRRVVVGLDIPARQRGGEYTGSVFDPRLQTKLGALTVMLKDPPRQPPTPQRPPQTLTGRDTLTVGNKSATSASVDRGAPTSESDAIELTAVEGVGPASAQKLKRAGIGDAGALAESDPMAINRALGASPASTQGHKLRRKARKLVS